MRAWVPSRECPPTPGLLPLLQSLIYQANGSNAKPMAPTCAESADTPCPPLLLRPVRQDRFLRGVEIRRSVKRFPRGLIFKAHRLLYHSTLGLREVKKVEIQGPGLKASISPPSYHANPYVGAFQIRSWSHWFVLGAILWAFIAKNGQGL